MHKESRNAGTHRCGKSDYARFVDFIRRNLHYVAAHFLFRGNAVACRNGGVAEPAQSFKMHGTAFFHEVRHDVGQGTEYGMSVGGRHGRLTGDAVGKFLRLDRLAHGDAAGIPQVVDSLLYSFPKYHTNLLFCVFRPSLSNAFATG